MTAGIRASAETRVSAESARHERRELSLLAEMQGIPRTPGSLDGAGTLAVRGVAILEDGSTLDIAQTILNADNAQGYGATLEIHGTGNTVNGAVSIESDGAYDGALLIGSAAGGNTGVTFTAGLTNGGIILLDTSDVSPVDTTLTVTGGVLANSGVINIVDGAGGGGNRTIDADIDNSGGEITVSAPAMIENTGHVFDTATGTITVNGTNTLTINGGTTIIGSGTELTDNVAGQIEFTGAAILALESDTGIVATDPKILFGGQSDAVTVTTVDAGPYVFEIAAGATLNWPSTDRTQAAMPR